MSKIPVHFEIGNRENMTTERLLDIVEQMYVELAEAVNRKPDIYERTTDGLASDVFLSNGTININNTTNKVEIVANHADIATVTWVTIS